MFYAIASPHNIRKTTNMYARCVFEICAYYGKGHCQHMEVVVKCVSGRCCAQPLDLNLVARLRYISLFVLIKVCSNAFFREASHPVRFPCHEPQQNTCRLTICHIFGILFFVTPCYFVHCLIA